MKLSNEQLAARVEVIVFDVDGVLTDGAIVYVGPELESKSFHVNDGQGVALARRAGLRLGMITARRSVVVQRRATELGVDLLLEGQSHKGHALRELMGKLRVKPSQVCYVGDDLVDLPALALAGFPVAVANAVEEVKAVAALVTAREGGRGAAREVVEFILKAKGLWQRVVQDYQDGR
jgi:3-deoxy-D-manno-octulosonate 8-phosphate phosphatase (KDO 8-P phosphatase)